VVAVGLADLVDVAEVLTGVSVGVSDTVGPVSHELPVG